MKPHPIVSSSIAGLILVIMSSVHDAGAKLLPDSSSFASRRSIDSSVFFRENLVPIEFIAKAFKLEGRGCGSGCAIRITPLSEVKEMPNHIKKVLVEETAYFLNYATNTWREVTISESSSQLWSQIPKNTRFWIFADCRNNTLAKGWRSDGADAQPRSIFDQRGYKKDGTIHGNTYDIWEQLCR